MLLVADGVFVAINYSSDKRSMQQSLDQEGQQLQTSFKVALSMTLDNMSQLATFLAGAPDLRNLFEQGVEAVEQEGGGPGGVESARLRGLLYDSVAPSWARMTEEYQVRQLHFHLGPGSTSFLRVHKPKKFGDNMDDVRHMVVDVNRDSQPRQGFELGRVYAGLRGIVPVFSDRTPGHQLGALEVGTSFTTLIDSLSASINGEIAILLKEGRVEDATWSRPGEPLNSTPCGCFIEATSSPALEFLLQARSQDDWYEPPEQGRTTLLHTEQGPIAVTEFALRDYIGERDGHEVSVGRIMIWKPATEIVQDLRDKTWLNIIYAAVGFVLIELALFWGIRLALRQLEQTVDDRTHEIQVLYAQMEEIAHKDSLTGVYVRRFFMERLEEELNRTRRLKLPSALLMLDVDHFKKVNDTWGHQAGDAVLSALGKTIRDSCRNYDIAGRYGGEEFCILLPNVSADDAMQKAEKLRKSVQDEVMIPDSGGRTATISVGVAPYAENMSTEEWLKAADNALYKAKNTGRNKVAQAFLISQ